MAIFDIVILSIAALCVFAFVVPGWYARHRQEVAAERMAEQGKRAAYSMQESTKRVEREAQEKCVRDWASGDAGKREEALGILRTFEVSAPMLSVLDRFVTAPSSFTCVLAVNKEKDLSVRMALEHNGNAKLDTALAFCSSHEKVHIDFPESDKVPKLSVDPGQLGLRILKLPGGVKSKAEVLALETTYCSSAHTAASLAYDRAIAEAAAPPAPEEYDA